MTSSASPDRFPEGPPETLTVERTFPYGCYRTASGQTFRPPAGWELLPPGDAMLTRRVKAAGAHWIVQERKGRKMFSRGVLAPSAVVAAMRSDVADEKADPAWQKRLDADRARREQKEVAYRATFFDEVLAFLAFPSAQEDMARRLARAVTDHATPVGSGTVARTSRIPVAERCEAAVIAWMRHQTTAYDHMRIDRVRGARREVRRELAQISRALLDAYRRGTPPEPAACPLVRALAAAPAP